MEIARSTMCDWMVAIADLARPLWELMAAGIRKSKVIHTDDTPVLVQDRARVLEGVHLEVSAVKAPGTARARDLAVEVTFRNAGSRQSASFVPLAVLISENGREVSESYGRSLKLAACSETSVALPIRTAAAAPGTYYLAIFPSDPETGRKVGQGKYRIPVTIRR